MGDDPFSLRPLGKATEHHGAKTNGRYAQAAAAK
jgi:hypothetical protein